VVNAVVASRVDRHKPVRVRDDRLEGELPTDLPGLLEGIALSTGSHNVGSQVLKFRNLIGEAPYGKTRVDRVGLSGAGLGDGRERGSVGTHHSKATQGADLTFPDCFRVGKLMRRLPIGVLLKGCVHLRGNDANVLAIVEGPRCLVLKVSLKLNQIVVPEGVALGQSGLGRLPVGEVNVGVRGQDVKNKLYLCLGCQHHCWGTLIVAYEIGLYLDRNCFRFQRISL